MNIIKVTIGVTGSLLFIAILGCSLCLMKKKNINLFQPFKMTSSVPSQRNESNEMTTGQIQAPPTQYFMTENDYYGNDAEAAVSDENHPTTNIEQGIPMGRVRSLLNMFNKQT